VRNAEEARAATVEAELAIGKGGPELVAQALTRISEAAASGERRVNLYYPSRLEAMFVGRDLTALGFTVQALHEPLTDADPKHSAHLLCEMHTIGVEW
jgi:hypothetical protein